MRTQESSVIKKDFQTTSGVIHYSLTVFSNPRRKEKFPLLVAFHGHGGSADEYLNLWKREADRRRIMILAPHRIVYRGKITVRPEIQLIEAIAQRYSIDKNKIYLAGVSSGGLMSKWLLWDRPLSWRGVVLVASPPLGKWGGDLHGRHYPPLLLVHGRKDHQFKFEEVVSDAEFLKTKGMKIEILDYPDAGHEQKPEWSREIFDWIEKNSGDHS